MQHRKSLWLRFPNQIGENGIFHIAHPENQTDIIQVTASDPDGDELNFQFMDGRICPILK